jgi:hypothetical protein
MGAASAKRSVQTWALGEFVAHDSTTSTDFEKGVPINIIAVLYCVLLTVMSFFPLFKDVTVQTMNWGESYRPSRP